MTTPSPSLLGSRKNSMTSLSSLVSSASTIGELRTGSHSSKTSSICGSLADGTSPFKQQNAMNVGAHINHYNATATTHPTEKQNILHNGNLNGNSMLTEPNDSGDFHSLQFQIDDNQPRKRARYCTFVQCLNPIINEEFGMLSEVCQIEDVMHKLMNITSTPGILPKSDEEVSLI